MMHDFTEELERRLVVAAEADGRARRAAGRIRSVPLAARAGGVAAALIAALAVVLAPGGPSRPAVASALPALEQPPVAGDFLRGRVNVSEGVRLVFDSAYAIETPRGRSYVLPAEIHAGSGELREALCLVIPNGGSGRMSFDSNCQDSASARRHGFVSIEATTSGTQAVVVLPFEAPSPTVRYSDGRTETLRVDDHGATSLYLTGSDGAELVVYGTPGTDPIRTHVPGRLPPGSPRGVGG